MAYPDEIDTPKDISARQRFQRYRGLRSFRTSPWDPYENLPLDYAKIFQFEDYRRTERIVRRKAEEESENIVDVCSPNLAHIFAHYNLSSVAWDKCYCLFKECSRRHCQKSRSGSSFDPIFALSARTQNVDH